MDEGVVGADRVGQLGRARRGPGRTAARRTRRDTSGRAPGSPAARLTAADRRAASGRCPRTNGPEWTISRAVASCRPVHSTPALQHLGLVAVTEHRVREQVVGARRDGASSARGCPPAPLEPVTAKSDGVTSRPARARGYRASCAAVAKQPGRRDARGAPRSSAPRRRRGRSGSGSRSSGAGWRAVVPLVQREILDPEIGREVDDEAGPGVEASPAPRCEDSPCSRPGRPRPRPRAASPGVAPGEAGVGERRERPDARRRSACPPGCGCVATHSVTSGCWSRRRSSSPPT